MDEVPYHEAEIDTLHDINEILKEAEKNLDCEIQIQSAKVKKAKKAAKRILSLMDVINAARQNKPILQTAKGKNASFLLSLSIFDVDLIQEELDRVKDSISDSLDSPYPISTLEKIGFCLAVIEALQILQQLTGSNSSLDDAQEFEPGSVSFFGFHPIPLSTPFQHLEFLDFVKNDWTQMRHSILQVESPKKSF